jgi:hypothetical protein
VTRLLLFLLVASNAAWFVVRTTRPERRVPRAERQDVRPEPPPEQPRDGAVAPEQAARRQALERAAEEQSRRGEMIQVAWKKRAAWQKRLAGRDRADAEAARAEVRAGLVDNDPATRLAALQAVLSVARFDAARRREQGGNAAGPSPEPLRPLLLPLLDSPEAQTRSLAAQALNAVGATPEDLPRVLALADDPAVRTTLPGLLRQVAGDSPPAQVREIVLRLLGDPNQTVVKWTLASWSGADLGPAFLAKVVELVGRRDVRRSAITYLGRLDEKPDRVVETLLDAPLIEDLQSGNAVLRVLRRGVAPRQHARIAEFFLRLLQLRDSTHVQVKCLEMLEQYGRRADAEVLERWAAEVEPGRYVRSRLDRTLDAIRRRG